MQRACKGKNRATQPSTNRRKSRAVRGVEEEEQELPTLDSSLPCEVRGISSLTPIQVKVRVDECIVRMVVDILGRPCL